ncbi:hypothetical protein [Halomicrobium salinisoli]|uniref:hypothetical protein n=1 Tax=Halomicrobium salinisoli TaxID=2878391 RepID=UPI001CF0C207|nr:hypothetical protein [Halomicrobium salinisoli]
MAGWSSPRPSPKAVAAGVVLYALVLAYALLIVQQVLLGILFGVFFAGLYFAWRLLRAIEAIADAQQRLADQRRRGE